MPKRRTRKAGKKQKKIRQKGGYVYSSRGPFDSINSFYAKDTHTVPMTSELFNYMKESDALIQPDPFQVLLGDYEPDSELVQGHKDTPVANLVRETGFDAGLAQFENKQLATLLEERANLDEDIAADLQKTEFVSGVTTSAPGREMQSGADGTGIDVVSQGPQASGELRKAELEARGPAADLTAQFEDDPTDPFVRDTEGKITGISDDVPESLRATVQRSLDATTGGQQAAAVGPATSYRDLYRTENRLNAPAPRPPQGGGGKRKRRKTKKHKKKRGKKGGKKGGRKGKRTCKH